MNKQLQLMEEYLLPIEINVSSLDDILTQISLIQGVQSFQYSIVGQQLCVQRTMTNNSFYNKQQQIITLREALILTIKAFKIVLRLEENNFIFGGYSSEDFIICDDLQVKYQVNFDLILMFLLNDYTQCSFCCAPELFDCIVCVESDVYSIGSILISFLQTKDLAQCLIKPSLELLHSKLQIQDLELLTLLQQMLNLDPQLRPSPKLSLEQLIYIQNRPSKCQFCAIQLQENFLNIQQALQTQNIKIISVIGEGSFGNVYLVQNLSKKQFVVKLIKLTSQYSMNLYISEVHTLLQFSTCQKIIQFISSDKLIINQQNFAIIQQEYAQQGNLRHFIQKYQDQLEEIDLLRIISDIIVGLEHIHAENIIHRDIKPENIFISGNYEAKIGDFGCNEVLFEGNSIESSFAGTIGYIAPEVINGQNISCKVDIWSLGIILQYFIDKFRPKDQIFSLLLNNCLKEDQNERFSATQLRKTTQQFEQHTINLKQQNFNVTNTQKFNFEEVKEDFTFSKFDTLQ